MTVFQTCRRHPNHPPFMRTCGGCAQDLYDLQERNRATAEAALSQRVAVALGLPKTWRPNPAIGETATRIFLWSQLELNDVFERVGGVVTARQAQRRLEGAQTTTETEITLTVELPGIGRVEAVTDWCDDLAAIGGDRTLPLMRALEATAV